MNTQMAAMPMPKSREGKLYAHARNIINAIKTARNETDKLGAGAPTQPNTGGEWVRTQAENIRELLNVAHFLAAQLSNELY